jgi:phage/plasmid-like protein (TIGR03299 family)
MTSEEAIKLANLDYEVAKTSIHAKIIKETDNWAEFKDRFATYRTDTNQPLGIVGGRYEIVQNREAFGFFDAIIDKGEAIFETAGVLDNGKRIFVTAKLPEDMLVGGEECKKYIILTNSHDGSSSIVAGFTTVRIVCNNTLQAALKGLSNRVLIEHRTGARERLSEAHKVMGIGSIYMDEVNKAFNQMAATSISDENLKLYITDVMKPEYKIDDEFSTMLKNQINSIYEFALSHPTQITNEARGTVWGAYNCISGHDNYLKRYFSQEVKFKSQLLGGNGEKKNIKAFGKALELCG